MSANTQRFRVGLDIGGTFTDLATFDAVTSEITQVKSLTTKDPVICVSNVLEKAARRAGMALTEFLPQIDLLFCFGSTIGLNTLLTRTGADVGIVTTRGHGDVYRIAEMDRGGVTDVREAVERTFTPLISRRCVGEVTERVDFTGTVIVPLDEGELLAAVEELVEEQNVDALVVSFLWAHRNASHEARARELIAARYPDLFVTTGAEISGSLGEFKRTSTAVINAYIGAAVRAQGDRLREFLSSRGLAVPLLVMQALGGVAPLSEIVRSPVNLLNSGPAGGVVGTQAVGLELGEANLVCMDVGGTSCDISAITEGEIELSGGMSILGHPIAISGVHIESIGAGGGSIATLERAGGLARLRVGPESAGASPGPVCYGRGGTRPTVTDANLILGLFDPDRKLGGEISLDLDAARSAITAYASQSGNPARVAEDAWGIYRVITAQMVDAIEDFLVSEGLDPRRYTLSAFGAAGGAHAAAVGARLGCPRVLVPNFFPVFSAFGLMTTDIRHAYSVTDDSIKIAVGGEADADLDSKAEYVSSRLREVARLPLALLEQEKVASSDTQIDLSLDLRYAGQVLELATAIDSNVLERDLSGADLKRLLEAWLAKYRRVYGDGAAWSEGDVELINYRAIGIGQIETPRMPVLNGNGTTAPRTRQIFLGEWLRADVWDDEQLAAGVQLSGPAVIESDLRTVLLGPGDTAELDRHGNLMITPGNRWSW